MAFWWSVLGLFLLLIFIWLIVTLARGGNGARPHIIQGPYIANVHKGGFDISVAMNMNGWVDYLIVPTSILNGRNPGSIELKEIQWSNVIWSESKLQVGNKRSFERS